MEKRRENLIVFRLKRNYAWSMSFLHTYLCKLVLAVFFSLANVNNNSHVADNLRTNCGRKKVTFTIGKQ